MSRYFNRRANGTLLLLLAFAVAGCSDNSNDDGGGTDGPSTPARGDLLETPPQLLATYSAAELVPRLASIVTEALLPDLGTPVCDVAVYHMRFSTVDGRNEATDGSGALMLPTGGDAARCSGRRPIVLYAHGTTTEHAFNIANLDNSENAEGLYLAAFFAAQGYIVVAPNYAGYDTSALDYHPYLVGEQQSKDMIDALTAARSALPASAAPQTTDSGSLYVTGYSQGGYVALATQRALEAAGQEVTASAPMSGPYAMLGFVDAVFAGRVNGGAPVLATFLITAYQQAYGDIYAMPSDIFSDQYAAGIETLLPSDRTRGQLYADGSLPQRAMFDSTPPDPSYADLTPATTPENLAAVFARGFGPEPLIRNGYRLSYLQDAQTNPDGGWPTTTNGEPAASPGLPFRQALKRNDLRTFTPAAPTLLCGGHQDPTVFWLNTQLLQSYWTSHGGATTPFEVLDVDANPTGADDPYEGTKDRFSIAKDLVAAAAVAQGADDGGEEAVLEAYHAGLVAPFCLEAAQSFFRAHP